LTVVINGNQRELAEGTAVVDLIAFLDLRPDRVAVEVNGRIVKRADWAGTALNDGDRIEVVQFVGGGSCR
jgi:thiamine biosynthesis protein ThiS